MVAPRMNLAPIQQFDEGDYDQVIVAHSTDTTIMYRCWAPVGSSQSAAVWRIQRVKSVSTSDPTKDVKGYPRKNASSPFTAAFEFKVTDAETLTFSQDA